MKMIEIDMNIMHAPQSYYLAQAISKDLNFNVGLPALFEKMYNMKQKIEVFYGNEHTGETDLNLGEAFLIDNVFNLVVKESSYHTPDKDLLLDAIIDMRDSMEYEMITKLAIPKICCGRNGLEWDEVKAMFEFVFEDSDVEILVCNQ
jgi:hypothetical protein